MDRSLVSFRFSLIVAVVMVATALANPARAQSGTGAAGGAATRREAHRLSRRIKGSRSIDRLRRRSCELLARDLSRSPRFVQVPFTSLEASAARGDFDIGLSGIEDSPARRGVGRHRPVTEFREILTVRGDRSPTVPHARGPARAQSGNPWRNARLRHAGRGAGQVRNHPGHL